MFDTPLEELINRKHSLIVLKLDRSTGRVQPRYRVRDRHEGGRTDGGQSGCSSDDGFRLGEVRPYFRLRGLMTSLGQQDVTYGGMSGIVPRYQEVESPRKTARLFRLFGSRAMGRVLAQTGSPK